jgi:CubicO group peptidase (beta-lactamase class C family)
VTVRLPTAAVACLLALGLAAPAQAAKRCAEPGAQWDRATPAEAGMDAAALQRAMDHGTQNLAYAVRVYRRGCLVAEDRLAGANRDATYESWSLAKSVTAMVFARAMTLGLIRPEDVVGGVVPEADTAHGRITAHDLLTMTSGLRWNGLRDYNIFTMPDRIVDALTLEPVHEPGTHFEYAQSAVSLLAAMVGRAAGEDVEAFAQRELMGPLGIEPGTWRWTRDRAGNVAGFMGVNMRPDDFGRLGELLRRGGTWRGRRLIDEGVVRTALTPTRTNACYGWLIWLNAGAPCVGPTISERPVRPQRRFPGLPTDLYTFSGLFGQLVTVMPRQELVVVRTGQDPGLVFAGGTSWEHELYRLVLASIRDERVAPSDDGAVPDEPNADYGFQTALLEPDQYARGVVQDPLPPAGPRRARAPRYELAVGRVSRTGRITLRMFCPPRPADHRCEGVAQLPRTRSAQRYSVAPGRSALVRFTLRSRELRKARRVRALRLDAVARNTDPAGGVAASPAARAAPGAAAPRLTRPPAGQLWRPSAMATQASHSGHGGFHG